MLRLQDALERDAPNGSFSDSKASEHGVLAVSTMADDAQSIGGKSDAIRSQLCELAGRLEGLLAGPAQELARDAQRVLGAMVCRIAVIGQVKAGKSSLINALIRRPELLPSDVNPWTTAVTRLHFGQKAEGQDIAAEFRFFDADEWSRLAEGGGRIRELTERLVPGFEAALLVQHLQAMRQRAAARLGSEFSKLLGTSHTFSTFDQSTLATYVSSGMTSGLPSADSSAGRYSDITKSAHLYMGEAPFGFPTTLIDTPGTNDPLLVRDEITRRMLDAADVYVVVLTARQALSTDDVALLRILRGLRKERIIVFVNRIDELGELETDLEVVQAQVARGLGREFLGVEVPIIYGSARWAHQALASEAGAGVARTAPALTALSKRHPSGAGSGAGTSSATSPNAHAEQETRDLLFMCSGISQLARALDRSIQQSHPAQVISHLVASFADLSRLNVLATRDELKLLESSINAAMHSARSKERRMREIADELDRLRILASNLEQSAGGFETTLMSTAESEIDDLEAALLGIVETFAETECQRLEEAIREGSHGYVWHCDTVPLRQKLEKEFSSWFRHTEARIMAAERDILPRLQQVIADVLPDPLEGRGLELRPSPMQSPSFSALGRIVALDLDEPWWKAWWTGKRAGEDRMRELGRLIRSEFAPIQEDLVRSAEEQILGQISVTTRQASAICVSLIEQLHRQSEKQGARMSELDRGAADAAVPPDSVERFTELDARLKTWSDVYSRLDALRVASARINRSDDIRS